jgi:hypothetical protein
MGSDDPDLRDYYRRFLIVELSDEQLREKEYWHNLFREKVGTHTDFEVQGKTLEEKLKPKETWDEFYRPYQQRKEVDLSDNLVIGWFES